LFYLKVFKKLNYFTLLQFAELIIEPNQLNTCITSLKRTPLSSSVELSPVHLLSLFQRRNSVDPSSPNEIISDQDANIDKEKTEKLFSFLQTLAATFNSFVHGSNDVLTFGLCNLAMFLRYQHCSYRNLDFSLWWCWNCFGSGHFGVSVSLRPWAQT